MNKCVLIIDDDDMLRRTLARGLANENFATITAESAESALEILARIHVDAIVLDRMMTGMDGLSFLQQIRQNGNLTPTIMLTAMTGAENTIAGLSGGANDYLAKPFQLRELVLRLKNILKNSPTNQSHTTLPTGLTMIDDDFFICGASGDTRILPLSGEEKKLLQLLTSPIGNIVPASPMVAKRLRGKINVVLSNLDIITIRGRGYKLVDTTPTKGTEI